MRRPEPPPTPKRQDALRPTALAGAGFCVFLAAVDLEVARAGDFLVPAVAPPAPEAAQNAYPGDSYVDYIGLDLYDQVWGIPLNPSLAWPRYVTETNGLAWLSSFAAAHHKPVRGSRQAIHQVHTDLR